MFIDANEKRNLDICTDLSFRSSNYHFFPNTKVSAFSPIVYIGQYVYNIFHASRIIVSIIYLCKQRIFFLQINYKCF